MARRLGAQGVPDHDLLARIQTDFPDMLRPFRGFRVTLRGQGAVLVCTEDGGNGLIEDYACTPRMDARLFDDLGMPCAFTLVAEEVCARPGRR